jgi:hypothetical protein
MGPTKEKVMLTTIIVTACCYAGALHLLKLARGRMAPSMSRDVLDVVLVVLGGPRPTTPK